VLEESECAVDEGACAVDETIVDDPVLDRCPVLLVDVDVPVLELKLVAAAEEDEGRSVCAEEDECVPAVAPPVSVCPVLLIVLLPLLAVPVAEAVAPFAVDEMPVAAADELDAKG